MDEPTSRNRLLIVDDERTFGEFIGMIARGEGYDVLISDETSEFGACLDQWRPTVVLIDLLMPNMDGVELLREMAYRKISAHILVASGVDARVLESARQMGLLLGLRIAGTLEKPVRVQEVRAILNKLLDKTRTVTAGRLREAIERDELYLDYQPKVEIASGRMVGVEALVRWRDGEHLIYPDAFVPLAEKEGLIDQLTATVLRQAIAQSGQWHKAGLATQLSINVSAANLHDLRLPDAIARLCEECRVPPYGLTLELTETATMQDPIRLMDVATRFRIKGFKLSIDDFGTGYSSLVQLQRLPFSEIKIDKSFTMEMVEGRDAATIVQIVIDIARRLALKVVAEGVEIESVLESLRQFGCDIAQGYFISRPVGAEQIPAVAAKWSGAAAAASEAAPAAP